MNAVKRECLFRYLGALMSPTRSWGRPKSATLVVWLCEESFQVGILLITYNIPKPLTHDLARKISQWKKRLRSRHQKKPMRSFVVCGANVANDKLTNKWKKLKFRDVCQTWSCFPRLQQGRFQREAFSLTMRCWWWFSMIFVVSKAGWISSSMVYQEWTPSKMVLPNYTLRHFQCSLVG